LNEYRNELVQAGQRIHSEADVLDDKVMKFAGGTVWLDVGGSHQIKTGVDILCSVEGSLLQRMFSGRHELRQDA